jgi:hypothetical protein
VLCAFGKHGQAYVETDPGQADRHGGDGRGQGCVLVFWASWSPQRGYDLHTLRPRIMPRAPFYSFPICGSPI